MTNALADSPIRVVEVALPARAVLARYGEPGGYADCLVATVPGRVTQAAYVEAFYTTALFKLERLALAVLLSRPSTDLEAKALATGETTRFAAWTVEGREADQILLRDFLGSSRSWLMSVVDTGGAEATTTLYFGTALVPRRRARGLGFGFRVMVPFHRLYARALLGAAVRRLMAGPPNS